MLIFVWPAPSASLSHLLSSSQTSVPLLELYLAGTLMPLNEEEAKEQEREEGRRVRGRGRGEKRERERERVKMMLITLRFH